MKPLKKVLKIWLILVLIHIIVIAVEVVAVNVLKISTFAFSGLALYLTAVFLGCKLGIPGLAKCASGWGWPGLTWLGWTVGVIIWLLVYFLIAVLIEKIFFKNEKH